MEAIIKWDSIVILTGAHRFVMVDLDSDSKTRQFPDMGLTLSPGCWDILPSKNSPSFQAEVFVASNQTIFTLDQATFQDQKIKRGPFVAMSLSPNGKFLALFTGQSRLWVVTTDFQTSLADFQTNSVSIPQQMKWCGNDAVLLHWEDTVLMVGPSGDYLKFPYEGIVHIISETDGARIISNEKHELIQKVSDSNEEIFKIGSTKPSAILYDAYQLYEMEDARADENIRLIMHALPNAISQCIAAASTTSDPMIQTQLLKAASFGKAFIESYPTEELVEMTRSLRIINSLFNIGIPLTYQQYLELTPTTVIKMLATLRHYPLAHQICKSLGIPADQVLTHWASRIVLSSLPDDKTIETIVSKLQNSSSISYIPIALAAFKIGRPNLASKLLELDTTTRNQTSLLLQMDLGSVALAKSDLINDVQSIFQTLFFLHTRLNASEFYKEIKKHPRSFKLWINYAKTNDRAGLRELYYQDDDRIQIANMIVEDALLIKDREERIREMKAAWKLFKEDKKYSNEMRAVEDEIRLIKVQELLEKEMGQTFDGLSLHETILKCLRMGQDDRAKKLKAEFKVDTQKYALLVART